MNRELNLAEQDDLVRRSMPPVDDDDDFVPLKPESVASLGVTDEEENSMCW